MCFASQVEKEELDLFELLEEAADENASFFSDASVVVNTMQQVIRQKEVNNLFSYEPMISLSAVNVLRERLNSRARSRCEGTIP